MILVAIAAMQVSQSLERFVYPLSKQLVCPPVVVDSSDLPAQEEWGKAAKAVVEQWYSNITALLATEKFKAPKQIRLVIKKEISAPAWASGDTITISGKWIASHPDDLGMIVHELTHVVQQYPGGKAPGWLVEGIADYIRWWRYEPEAPRSKIDFGKANYTDAYRTTAWWLAWSSQKYNRGLVPALDRALREGKDGMDVFEKMTGKDADQLWQEFKASQSS